MKYDAMVCMNVAEAESVECIKISPSQMEIYNDILMKVHSPPVSVCVRKKTLCLSEIFKS